MKRKNRLLQENNSSSTLTSRRIDPLTAAGVLLIAISVTALITYAALVLPSKIVAAGGPPDEFIAAATQQALQPTLTPTPLNAAAEDESDTPDTSDDSAAADSGEPTLVPTLTPTENPRGDWPLPENVVIDYWISIPNIGLEAPIIALSPRAWEIEGVVVERLPVPHSYSVAWDASSATPGFAGNTILTGHNNLYGGVFQNLQMVQPGWEIAVWSELGVFSYYVSTVEYVEEDGVAVEQRMQNSHWLASTGDNRLTLITCWPNVQTSHRLIVVATR